MNSGNHPKLVLARKNMSVAEIKTKTSPFDTKFWKERLKSIKKRVQDDLAEIQRLKIIKFN